MSQTTDHDIGKIDALLGKLLRERRRSTDPADILRVSESIDRRLDERLGLMRSRDCKADAELGGAGLGRQRDRQSSH